MQRISHALDRNRRFWHELSQSAAVALGHHNLLLITDEQGWVLKDFSQQVLEHLRGGWRGRVIDIVPQGVTGKTVHFVERYRFLRLDDPAPLVGHNHVVLTWWHGGSSDVEHIHLDELLKRVETISALPVIFHITSSLYREVLLRLGVREDQIVYRPMGVDLERFRLHGSRNDYKMRLGIPQDKMCIGYFQRDGDEQPKLVKGPDVFVDVMRRLWPERNDLFVLLTGPKRGYVRRHLEQIGIPYHYAGFVDRTQIPAYYGASDLYLITSREEGGPAAVLECMATGTPLVSTRVGMAVDVIKDGENGYLTGVEDAAALADRAMALIRDADQRKRISEAALATACRYDWSVIAPQYGEMYAVRVQGNGRL